MHGYHTSRDSQTRRQRSQYQGVPLATPGPLRATSALPRSPSPTSIWCHQHHHPSYEESILCHPSAIPTRPGLERKPVNLFFLPPSSRFCLIGLFAPSLASAETRLPRFLLLTTGFYHIAQSLISRISLGSPQTLLFYFIAPTDPPSFVFSLSALLRPAPPLHCTLARPFAPANDIGFHGLCAGLRCALSVTWLIPVWLGRSKFVAWRLLCRFASATTPHRSSTKLPLVRHLAHRFGVGLWERFPFHFPPEFFFFYGDRFFCPCPSINSRRSVSTTISSSSCSVMRIMCYRLNHRRWNAGNHVCNCCRVLGSSLTPHGCSSTSILGSLPPFFNPTSPSCASSMIQYHRDHHIITSDVR